jgi:prepilin-type N-terminal cleavage/methylation domain-containing protein
MEFNRLGTVKGFTLIELAVVLVVIGIIIGMSFKGLELIDTANTRSEIQKMLKIRNSLAAWISVNTKTEAANDFRTENDPARLLGAFDNDSIYRFSDLEDLTDDDGKNPFGKLWYLIRGDAKDSGYELANKDGDSFFLYSDNLSKRFVCYTEVLMDDDNTTTGTIRSEFSDADIKHDKGCYDNLSNSPVAADFYYRLF